MYVNWFYVILWLKNKDIYAELNGIYLPGTYHVAQTGLNQLAVLRP